MKTRKIDVPKLEFRASFKPDTYNKEDRTVEVVFSNGVRVKRYDWWNDEVFFEELSMERGAVRLERFNRGAPVLKDHRASVDSMIGVIELAETDGKTGTAKVRFSSRPEIQSLIEDIRSGVVRNVSVGYNIHRLKEVDPVVEETTKADGTKVEKRTRVFRAIDWEPMELSFVAVPADASAQVRSADVGVKYPCEVIFREESAMSLDSTNGKGSPSMNQGEVRTAPKENSTVNVEEIRAQAEKEAVEKERGRALEIREAVKVAKLSSEVADDMISRGISADAARKEVLAKIAEADKATATRSTNVSVGEDLSQRSMRDGIVNAILHRHNSKRTKLEEPGQPWARVRMIDMVRELLEQKGVNTRGMSPMEIATRGMHSTSDFPLLLANVLNKTLRAAYSESPQTFRPMTRVTQVSDFKEISRAQLGDAPKLLKKPEGGEYKHGTVGEAAEKYAVETYGRIVGVTREMIINDDLSAFARLPEMYGRAAANLESDLIWAIVNSNPVMSDGVALFHATHGNLSGTSDAIAVASLGAGREAMRLQKGLGGNKLNLSPRFLVVPVKKETIADQFVTTITPNASSSVNPFSQNGRMPLSVIAEPRLDDSSTTAWYLFADVAEVDIFEMAFLTGEEGPVLESEMDFNTDGIKYKARHTVGVKAIDWRGMYKNAGA